MVSPWNPTPANDQPAIASLLEDPLSYRRRLVVDGGVFVLLALITMIIPLIYVPNERFFYFWDLALYENMTSAKAIEFSQSPLKAMYRVIRFIGNNYNEIFTIPLIPFVLIFGDTRLVYVTSTALVDLLPFALVLGAIAVKLIPFYPRPLFWSAVLLTLLTPTVWGPTLKGWPDAGGASLIALAVWLYLQDITLKRWWQIVLIGFFIATAMLFRRHFAYAGVAFFVSMMLQALIASSARALQRPREALRNLFVSVVRICLTIAASLITLAVVGWPFLYNLLTRDYGVHASYVLPFDKNLWFYASRYGLAACVLAVLGLAVGLRTRLLVRPVATFIILFGSFSLIQWLFIVRQLGDQYTFHFTFFIVLGLTALGWKAWIMPRGRERALVVSAAVLYLVINTMNGLTPAHIPKNYAVRRFFSATYSPLVRPDYEEVVRLIQHLRSIAPRKEPIYVAASSELLNWDILRNAERILFGRDFTILNIPYTPEVDSRDFYPQALERLLEAQYVLVATPFQHHLRAEEQDVVKVVFVAFTENWEIAQDFTPLPEQFFLAKGVVVNVYKRAHATSLERALRTLQAMERFIGHVPPSERSTGSFSATRLGLLWVKMRMPASSSRAAWDITAGRWQPGFFIWAWYRIK